MKSLGYSPPADSNRGAPLTHDHHWSPAQATRATPIAALTTALRRNVSRPLRHKSEQCLSQASSAAAARRAQRAQRHKMFGPRRGYDAIGEPAVSNADKPRVQPVKVDPKAFIPASRGVATPSRRRRASSPREMVNGGLFVDFEAVRTASRDRDGPFGPI